MGASIHLSCGLQVLPAKVLSSEAGLWVIETNRPVAADPGAPAIALHPDAPAPRILLSERLRFVR